VTEDQAWANYRFAQRRFALLAATHTHHKDDAWFQRQSLRAREAQSEMDQARADWLATAQKKSPGL
jgi:hypothetical protein